MTEHHTLADRLRARANQLGLSPAHVAEMAGVNRSFVYDILRGRSMRPGIDRLGEVARVLKVDRDWLIHGIGDVEGPSPFIDNPDEAFVSIAHASPRPSMGGGAVVVEDGDTPGIFVLDDGMGLVAKRLEHIANSDPPAVRVISDNGFYSPYERTADEIHIVGRIRWFAREI